jgi:hypothetical protein
MAHCRLTFDSLDLFEDEEAGDTHMAIYASVVASDGTQLATFKWNNLGGKVNETATYNLAVDPANPATVDFDLTGAGTLSIDGWTHDDNSWPSSGSGNFENHLGTVTHPFDPAASVSLGSLLLGPSTTDNGNAGYSVRAQLETVAPSGPASVRVTFENLVLYEDEEAGDTHMAIYVHASAPAQNGVDAISKELFRWNNFGNKVNEVNSYTLSGGGTPSAVRLELGGPTQIWVEGYADDDQDWPSSGSNENSLGQATITIDPNDPSTLGSRTIGPTRTDNDNQGYEINATVERLPDTPDAPDLAITGVELTQAVQRFASSTGPDNSLPLIEKKATMVRVYLDSGADPAGPGGGIVANVSGKLTVTGSANETLDVNGFTAKPAGQVSRGSLSDTMNFVLSQDICSGTLNLTAEASVAGSTAAPVQIAATFRSVVSRNILMLRIGTPSVTPPDRSTYFAAVNALTTIYPIPTSPGDAIVYWLDPGNETFITTRNLMNLSEMDDLLEDIEDIQEDGEDWQKLYGLVAGGVPMTRVGDSTENQAFGYAGLTGSVAHELGHLYGLDHAPCGPPGGVQPDDPDGDYRPSDGSTGDVGVDVLANVAFPASDGDFMSYCGPSWIGSYHWSKLFDRFQDR